MKALFKLGWYFLWFPVYLLYGCQLQGKEAANPDKKDITIRDLYRAARAQQKILLVDAWQQIEYADSLRALIDQFHHPDWQLTVKDHRQVTEEELSSTPVMLVGTPVENRWMHRLIKHLPFDFHGNQIILSGHQFDGRQHALTLSYYPNPLNVKLPVGVFTSASESLIWEMAYQRITSLIRSSWNYQIVRNRKNIMLGNFSQEPGTRWEFDQAQQLILPAEIVQQWKSEKFIFKSYHEALNATTMSKLATACQKKLAGMEELTGTRLSAPVSYYLYPSTEVKGLMTGNTDQSHVDFENNEVHTAFDEHFINRYSGKENQLILRNLLGKPSYDALEAGLSICFIPDWQKYGSNYWARRLLNAGNKLTVAQLLNPDQFFMLSVLIRESMAGSLTSFLMNHWGREKFLNHYRSWNPGKQEMDDLTTVWWSELASGGSATIASKAVEAMPYLQGFNFTHEGYQIYNGYGSSLSARSLEMIAGLGSNAVAIVPYSWMRDPGEPAVFRFSQRPGSENDEGVIHAISHAKKNGLFTLLKPHVWISGSWPGEVEMRTESDWELFFDHYFQWISHYALMAEMYEVDAFCIGVEFSKATLGQEQRWRELISKIRGIYSGPITYAANWGDEFEEIRFWDLVDFIGLNCYYPLSDKQSPAEAELRRGFKEVLKKVNQVKNRYQKPVVLTEIGFRSVEAPWIQPHAEAGEKLYDELDQAASYQAVFQAIFEMPVVDGILWWKWPTNPESRTEEDRRFVPSGKKAESIIREWFSTKK